MLLFTQNAIAQLGFCTGNSGDPIFTENFGMGTTNTPLPAGTTTYPFSTGYPVDGFYTVSDGTFGNSFDWHQTVDHTPFDSNGKCLIVNAAASPGEFYRTTVTGLCETTTYEFSAWVLNLVRAGTFCSRQPGGTIPINVGFEIWDSTDTNLLASGNTGNITQTSAPNWEQYGLVFQTSPAQNTVILKMINNGLGGCGNDLAIDDIEFKACGDTVVVNDASNATAFSLCSSQAPFTETLTATPDFTVYSSHFYQWQSSIDNGVTWNDVVGENNQTLAVSVSTSTYYRAKIAEVAINLTNPLCVAFSNEYQVTVNQLPPMPNIACWETATIDAATCSWNVSGTQPAQPNTECWETATFNDTTCMWEVSGMQPLQPVLECWETATFNTTTCMWEVSGMQPAQPNTECWETATFNATSCTWEVAGSQPVQPTLACWETATFNNTTCVWDVSGSQPVAPTLECWQTTVFNTMTCTWDTSGVQPLEPTTACWETATFNSTVCDWQVTGTQPEQPSLECWQTASFNQANCMWQVTGTQPGTIVEAFVDFCPNDDKQLTAQTNIPNPSYLWNNGATTQSIEITTEGVFSVEITGGVCDFETRIFDVQFLDIPVIDSVISEGKTILINTLDTGDYLYSIDGGDTFQTSNVFSNIEGGVYAIAVKNNSCNDIVTMQYLHFFIPRFFTPNNDGVNDTFNLGGIAFFSSSEVSIFNRYGKLIKYSRNNTFSWDGTFNGQVLPTDDYWYVIIIEGQKFTGHFSLKR